MVDFTAKGALLVGFDLIRRRPLLVLLWAGIFLLQTIAFAAVYRLFIVAAQASIFDGGAASASFRGETFAFTLARAAVSLVVISVVWSSAFRALLRPAERGPLAFGLEELSVLASWLIVQLVVAAVSAPLPVFLVSRFNGLNAQVIVQAVAAIEVLGRFWGVVAAVWAFERLRIAPFRCWSIARGRFWLLAVLIVGPAILERLVDAAVHRLVLALGRGLPFATPVPAYRFAPSGAQLQALFQPPALLQDVILAGIGALMVAFMAGVVASAYRASLSEPQAASFAGSVAEPS